MSDVLPYLELGNASGPVLVCLAGYPDDCISGWAPIISQYEARYRILALCLPHFDGGKTVHGWGYSFPMLVNM